MSSGQGISARVIEDSVGLQGAKRLTTLICRYPRFIHSEVMTHRVMSRNAASSRAIPLKKMIEQVNSDPAMPIWWGKNQPGMQAREQLSSEDITKAKEQWLQARDEAVKYAQKLGEIGLHKQVVNRILEPWMYMVCLITATEWDNFFHLRRHPDAQPEMKELADCIFLARATSKPRILGENEWHLPFVQTSERGSDIDILLKCSVARCARVSYLNHDGTSPNIEKDLALHDSLLKSGHMSPLEHQARPIVDPRTLTSGNLVDWIAYRKTIPDEAVFNP